MYQKSENPNNSTSKKENNRVHISMFVPVHVSLKEASVVYSHKQNPLFPHQKIHQPVSDRAMAGEEESTLDGGTYSELLFADDDDGLGGCFSFTTSSSPKMLCFGIDSPILENSSVQTPEPKTQISGLTCSGDSQSACSSSNISKSNKKRNGAEKESVEKTKAGNQRNCKRTKLLENSNVSTAHAKVKKEKLGERITALQQLVSPFGKTDTASVLHEAMGYIRFLHDQVHVLCSPYLQRQSQSQSQSPSLREGGETEASRNKVLLRSKGLCLVPTELTFHVADTTLNGADFWSPAAMMKSNRSITQ